MSSSRLYNAQAIDDRIVIRMLQRWSEAAMTTVTVSPKYQVVIPKDVRERLGLLPGHKVQAIAYEDRIELVPVQPVNKMRGFLRGIDTDVPREDDRI
jgi:AbrB family looped-hinge helix DNA binding protein